MLTDSVAEIAVSLVLDSLRNIVKSVNTVSSGQWESLTRAWAPGSDLFNNLGESLINKKIGFLGLGRIGLAIAQRLRPFGVSDIFYHNRSKNVEAEEKVFIKSKC